MARGFFKKHRVDGNTVDGADLPTRQELIDRLCSCWLFDAPITEITSGVLDASMRWPAMFREED